MADLNKEAVRREITHSGTYGNRTGKVFTYTAAAAPIASKIYLGKIPAGAYITDLRMVTPNLGSSSTVALGWEYVDGAAGGGAAVLLAATSTSSASNTRMALAPHKVERDIWVYATVAGGAITGLLTVFIDWVFDGAK